MNRDLRAALPDDLAALEGTAMIEESVWLEVVRKMDEVYSDLVQYEVALEDKNRALEESREFILSVLGAMSDVLVVLDRRGRIEVTNAALAKLSGIAVEALVGRTFASLVASDDGRARLAAAIGAGRTAHDCEIDLLSADGAPMPVTMNCTPRTNKLGKVVGSVITGRPIGELRRAYAALSVAHEELKRAQAQLVQAEKLASLGRLVAGVAHELNNPISFVLGNVHALARYGARLATYLDAVHANVEIDARERLRRDLRIDRILGDLAPLVEGTVEGAERTRDIVAGLKRFSAVDREPAQAFDLRDPLRRAVEWVTRSIAPAMRVEIDLPAPLPMQGSAVQLQQVAMNLVQNAVDSMAGASGAALVIRDASRDGATIVVELQDTGPGIAPDILPRIFDPFFTTKPVGKGTGLGLSISYGIVERHGGRLEADNAPAGGARFTLRLPRLVHCASTAQSEAVLPPPRGA